MKVNQSLNARTGEQAYDYTAVIIIYVAVSDRHGRHHLESISPLSAMRKCNKILISTKKKSANYLKNMVKKLFGF